MKRCTKAIIPVAGYGTRRLPLTKSVEKCMLPLLNRPVVDYVVSDCVAAGVTDIYFVVSGPATQLRDYYSRDVELEDYLVTKGKPELRDAIVPYEGVRFHFIEQDLSDGRYGTTVPVWLCRDYIEPDELVAVLFADATTYTPGQASDIEQMIAAGQPAILGIMADEGEDLRKKGGVLSLNSDGSFRAIVEHADPTVEPSRLKNCGFYLLPGDIVNVAERQVRSGAVSYNGEYFFTDAVTELAKRHHLKVIELTGAFLDAGSLDSWVSANNWLFEHYIDK